MGEIILYAGERTLPCMANLREILSLSVLTDLSSYMPGPLSCMHKAGLGSRFLDSHTQISHLAQLKRLAGCSDL